MSVQNADAPLVYGQPFKDDATVTTIADASIIARIYRSRIYIVGIYVGGIWVVWIWVVWIWVTIDSGTAACTTAS